MNIFTPVGAVDADVNNSEPTRNRIEPKKESFDKIFTSFFSSLSFDGGGEDMMVISCFSSLSMDCFETWPCDRPDWLILLPDECFMETRSDEFARSEV